MSPFRRFSPTAARSVTITVSAIGLVVLAVGVGFAWSSISLLSVAHRIEGRVIRLNHNFDPGPHQHRGSMAPVVEFQLNGQRHEFQSWLFTSPPQFTVGDKVTVLYDPNDPGRAGIESFVTMWLFPTIFGGIGAVVSLVAIGLWIFAWPRQAVDPLASASSESDSGNLLDERTET